MKRLIPLLNILILVIGIALLVFGGYQSTRYDRALEQGYEVTATVTNIKTKDDTDDGPTSYHHYLYGEYTVNGKTYENVHLGTRYTSSRIPPVSVGETVSVIIDPEDPGKRMSDGGGFIIAGILLTVVGIIKVSQGKRRPASGNIANATAQAPVQSPTDSNPTEERNNK